MLKNLSEIKKCPLFEKLSDKSLELLSSSGGTEVITASSGDIISSPDSDCRALYAIIAGEAEIRSPDSQSGALLRKIYPGDVFGVANLFDGSAGFVSIITATKKCKIIRIDAAAAEQLLKSDPDFMMTYIGFLSGRIRFLNRKIMFFTSGSADRRLALYLYSFGTEKVVPDLNMNGLSELLDIGRASLYRAMDTLSDSGLVRREGDSFIIENREMLKEKYKL